MVYSTKYPLFEQNPHAIELLTQHLGPNVAGIIWATSSSEPKTENKNSLNILFLLNYLSDGLFSHQHFPSPGKKEEKKQINSLCISKSFYSEFHAHHFFYDSHEALNKNLAISLHFHHTRKLKENDPKKNIYLITSISDMDYSLNFCSSLISKKNIPIKLTYLI